VGVRQGRSFVANAVGSTFNVRTLVMSKKVEKNLKKKINARKAKIAKHEGKLKSLKKKLKKASK
jgi:Skp family chaperone for outer membrane proteins